MTQPVLQPVLHSTPRPRDVLREQVSALGIAIRLPAVVAVVLAALATIFVASRLFDAGKPIDFAPELSMLPGIAGLLLPIGVWRGEDRFGAGLLWTLPVDRRHHALTRVCAGWVWLMAAVALFVLWLLAITLISGGNVTAESTISVLPSSVVPEPGTLDPASLESVRWAPRPLLWLVPFTAATGAYLLASAFALGTRHPIRWLVGAVLAFFAFLGFAEATHSRVLLQGGNRVLVALMDGAYGIDALLTARTESLHTEATLSTGERVGVWRGLPDLGQWVKATLLWTGVGLAALWAAASRHRERRRG
jgi:hypothetical protein